MNKFLNEFKDRGYFYQCTNENELSDLLDNKKIHAYIGFDSTASSLHVGSLIQIMCLRLLQKHGHRPIVLLGGGTTRIGDPSGKEETRKILSEKQIESNIKSIQRVFNIFLKSDNPKLKPIFVNNYKWLGKLNYINFLREIGKHFTINKMLSFESVKLRLEREQSLSYMEFNYMILQAYDFLELNKTKNCLLQIGGSDQWGNIVNGVELIKRHSNKHVYGLTTPLITLASGTKMGKTEKGAIWLDKKLLSPYDYYQFWRNTDDKDVIKFLKMFTDLEVSKIENMKNMNINDLKEKLALEATKMLHGQNEANKAFKTSISIFVKKEINNQTELPIIKIKKNELKEGLSILDLVVRSKLLKSKGEVRRAIKDNGIKINDIPIERENYLVSLKIFENLNLIKLSHGKKNHVIIKLTN
ncbi:tyrosine--tRNA ligase [Candidatus Pelagibacter communis]|uniref:tyrosine--tRNA ligase n=1 Tax=Pelagibacter ubique TaxID=198252 RepID=UPI00094BF635|nr:tyrosine--tRNA ligase [Candidatus Pelagibacter ubique]